MRNILVILISFIFVIKSYSQVNIVTSSKLVINHGDITLYLDSDTTTMLSKHVLSYNNFKHIGKYDRCNCWFQDVYIGKYNKSKFAHTGFDLGHLTPSHITSYDSVMNHNSFSMFNEAPQFAFFNEHPWEQLEMSVEDTIAKYKSDAVIITGVVYDNSHKIYLPNSRIKIPLYYFKVLSIGTRTFVWLGVNVNGKTECIINIKTLKDLNQLFINYKMDLRLN